MVKVHNYNTVITGSNYAPLTLDLRDARTGLAIDLTGASVTITIRDETTGEAIVTDGTAEPNTVNPYWIEFFFTQQQTEKITAPSVWIGEWTLTAGNGRKHLVPVVCRIPVRPQVM